MAIENRNLPVGTRIWANYKKTRYVCTVESGEEEGSLSYVLEDGTRHKSPSAAGSKVMGGKAVNGWRFWTVEGDEPAPAPQAGSSQRSAAAKRSRQRPSSRRRVRARRPKAKRATSARPA